MLRSESPGLPAMLARSGVRARPGRGKLSARPRSGPTRCSLKSAVVGPNAASSNSGAPPSAFSLLVVGILPNVPGFLAAAGLVSHASVPAVFHDLYTYAWFVGFGLGFGLYAAFGLPRSQRRTLVSA